MRRSPRNSASSAKSPRWQSSPRCTGSAPAQPAKPSAIWNALTRSLWACSYASGVARQPLRTFGGRRINLDADWPGSDDGGRGRFARNALIQGSAAELFKAWAATVRHVTAPTGAQIVLCLHDELLLQAPEDRAEEVADAVQRCLEDSARRWAGTDQVRFVADTGVIRRWSDAK